MSPWVNAMIKISCTTKTWYANVVASKMAFTFFDCKYCFIDCVSKGIYLWHSKQMFQFLFKK
jgi:hypothetical protein